MKFKRQNKLDMMVIEVASKEGTMAKSGTLVGTGSELGILDGQIGLMSADFNGTKAYGEFLSGGETSTDVKAVQFIQGTPASSNLFDHDPWQVDDISYVASGTLHKDNVRSMTIEVPKVAQYGTDFVTDISNPTSLTEYGLFVEIMSRRTRKEFGSNGNREVVSFDTPDFTLNAVTDQKDFMLQNLLTKLNSGSAAFVSASGKQTGRQPFVSFGVNASGGSGVAIGTLQVGDIVPVMTWNGYTTTFTMTQGAIAGLAEAIKASTDSDSTAKLTATSTIQLIDAANAGSAANIDSFIVMGLEDRIQRGVDTETSKMVTVKTNLKYGFRVTNGFTQSRSYPRQDVNSGRSWSIANRERAQRAVHNLYSDTDYASFNVPEGVNYVKGDSPYTAVIIDYFDFENTLTTTEYDPKQFVLLFPSVITNVNVTAALANITAGDPAFPVLTPSIDGSTASATLLADFKAIVEPWIASNNEVVIQSEI